MQISDDLDNDGNDFEEGTSENSWETCAAEVKVLASFVNDCTTVITKVLLSEIVYPEELLTDLMLKIHSTTLENKCQATLSTIYVNKSKVRVVQDQDNDDYISLQDPADRPATLTDQQKQTIIENGPYQPKLKTYPKNPTIGPSRQRRFLPSWFKEYPHMEYSVKTDSVICFVCRLFPRGIGREKANDAWITGVKSWDKMKSRGKDNKGKMAQHFTSASHKAALSELAHFAHDMNHVDVMLDKQLRAAKIQEEESNIRNREAIKILLDISKTLAEQELAFRGNDGSEGNFIAIAKLVARHNSYLKSWLSDETMKPYSVKYLSPASQNEFISLLADDVKSQISRDLNSAGFYSVMADTSPDTSNTDRLVDKTGEGQATEILDSLNSRVSNESELVYQSYDYTASMSGNFKGAQQCLQDTVGRSIPYIPCQSHR